jgi:hypothetical protein
MQTADPAAMRDHARFWRARAALLLEQVQRLQGDVEAMPFEGPAAERVRAGVAVEARAAAATAGELERMAADLERDADRLEAA